MVDDLFNVYISLVDEYISFRSISTLDATDEINKTVDWLEKLFVSNHFKAEIIRGYDNPVIISEFVVDESFPTVLIYGHYDVQPASEDEWGTNPFVVRNEKGRLYARGIVDNKGQMLVHLVSVLELIRKNKLKYNVKFLIQGNEETGSPNIGKLLEKHKQKLRSDLILISDSALLKNHPTIEMSLRGVFNTTLTIRTSNKDLHSGLFGGAVPNSAQIASEFISKLRSSESLVNIDGFYENVIKPDEKYLELTRKIPFNDDEFSDLTGTKAVLLENGHNFYSQTGLRPTVEVTGLESGYTGSGYRNSIPSQTVIKFNFRLVPCQNPEEILEKFKMFTRKMLPEYADFDFAKPEKTEGTVKPIMLNPENKFTKKAVKLLEQIHNKDVLYDFNGATLPIVVDFTNILKTDMLMVALANEDCNMHAVDENFDLQSLRKALEFSYKFLSS
ncbi:MAG TPA: M20/M25/M40 family metallo-hydrolase [Candidatus Dojkabacteria bacterium]|nr:M20/M25/M40 family metallo-hydrolase [Candidatus Dojkabacteria bacterium]